MVVLVIMIVILVILIVIGSRGSRAWQIARTNNNTTIVECYSHNIYIYTHTCVYIYIYICIYIYIYVYMCVYICITLNVSLSLSLYIYIYICNIKHVYVVGSVFRCPGSTSFHKTEMASARCLRQNIKGCHLLYIRTSIQNIHWDSSTSFKFRCVVRDKT